MAVQRVRRVIRKIDPWTVLKVSLVFNAIMALVFVLGTVIFWSIFVNAGIPQKINDLALLIGLENGINLDGAVYFRIVLLLSVIGTILVTGFLTLGSVVYNLISDLVGGLEVIVLEETVAPQVARPRVTLPTARRPVVVPAARRGILPTIKAAVRPKAEPVVPESEVERTGS
ncbi:MAG TPA: DUF3566 domain-containing protein [Acidimicrobiia bacterium]|nr:DUF3566 domain-containing protein [Acidimicrobiia bacterium]